MNEITNPVVAALPGDGWYAMFREHDGLLRGEKVVGWLVYGDGNVCPFVIRADKSTDPTTLPAFVRLEEIR